MFFRMAVVGLIVTFWSIDIPRAWRDAGFGYLPAPLRMSMRGSIPTWQQAIGRLTSFDIPISSVIGVNGRATPTTGAPTIGLRGLAALPPELARVWSAPIVRMPDIPVPSWGRMAGRRLVDGVWRELDRRLRQDRFGRL